MTSGEEPVEQKPASKPVVRIVHPGYQPRKTELQEGLSLPEGTTPQQLANAVTRSVKVRHVMRPPKK